MIHVGDSARGEINKEVLQNLNRNIQKANIPGTIVHFGGSSQIVSGKTMAEKTVIGVFSPEYIKNFFNADAENLAGFHIKAGSKFGLDKETQKAYQTLFKYDSIKIGRKLKKAEDFIILNSDYLSNSLHGFNTTFHEIGHAFSSEAGLTYRDSYALNDKIDLALNDALANPGDFSAYKKAFNTHIDLMKGKGLEEARADSIGLSLMVKSGLVDDINKNAKSATEFLPYTGLPSWKGYEERVSGEFQSIIENLHATTGEEHLVEEMMSNFRKQGRFAAHTAYHANLQIPQEIERTMRPLIKDVFSHEEDKIKRLKGADVADEYRNLIESNVINAEGSSMSVGDVVSHNFSARNAEQVFEAHANMVRPSLLPAMADESISTAGAIIESSASAAPEIAERTLEAGVTRLSRGGLKMFGSAAKRTSSRIIERNGNCS
jgi:hypothetical protein